MQGAGPLRFVPIHIEGGILMEQFYCLSVLANCIAGLILVYGTDLTKKTDSTAVVPAEDSGGGKNALPEKKAAANLLDGKNLRLVVGILSVVVGFMKILLAYGGIPVLGDLLPAAAGLAGGAAILIEYYVTSTTDESFSLSENLQIFFINSRKYLGVACLAVALLHFIFPRALFL